MKFLLLFFGLILGLGIIEVTVSKVMPIHSFLYRFHPERTIFEPGGINRIVRLKNYDSRFIANNLGYHDYDRTLLKKHNRILVIGDSFVEAPQIDDLDNMITSRLENMINANNVGCKEWEAIPLGMSGMGTAQHLALYEKFAKKLKPDVVIYIMVYNDLQNNMNKALKPRYRLDENDDFIYVPSRTYKTPKVKRMVLDILRKFDAYHAFRTIPYLMRQQQVLRNRPERVRAAMLAEGGRQEALNDVPEEIAWYYFEQLLLDFKQAVERDGAKFLQAIQDSNTIDHDDPEVKYFNDPVSDRVKNICYSSWMSCVTFKKSFREEFLRTGNKGNWRNDRHWDEVGHRVVAEVLYSKLRKLGWLKRESCSKN